MLKVGATDAFEHEYMAKFEALAAKYGIFVKYERDRAARDIGLHLTKEIDGTRRVTNTVCWFQMKGVMASTLSVEKFSDLKTIDLPMRVEHLRHWYLDKEPTHLVVYVQSNDTFLVLNLQRYVESEWGRDVFALDQETATVKVPTSSLLDEQAFSLLLRLGDVEQWARAIGVSIEDVKLLHRDFDVIWQVAMAPDQGKQCGALYTEWISKTRHELTLAQRPANFAGELGEG